MSPFILIHRFPLFVLTVFFALTPLHALAYAPAPLTTISNPQLPNNTDVNANTTLGGDPPIKVVAMDATHTVYFTKYQHLFPERNYYAAIVSIQTSLMAQYFDRQPASGTMYPGPIAFEAFGVRIFLQNPTNQLGYAVAHRLFGELAEFLMQGNFCTARFEMWEIWGGGGRQLCVGWIVPGTGTGSGSGTIK